MNSDNFLTLFAYVHCYSLCHFQLVLIWSMTVTETYSSWDENGKNNTSAQVTSNFCSLHFSWILQQTTDLTYHSSSSVSFSCSFAISIFSTTDSTWLHTFCFSTQKFMFITTPACLITQDLSHLCTFSLCLCWVVKLSSSLLSISPWECIIEEKMTRRKESGKIFIN